LRLARTPVPRLTTTKRQVVHSYSLQHLIHEYACKSSSNFGGSIRSLDRSSSRLQISWAVAERALQSHRGPPSLHIEGLCKTTSRKPTMCNRVPAHTQLMTGEPTSPAAGTLDQHTHVCTCQQKPVNDRTPLPRHYYLACDVCHVDHGWHSTRQHPQKAVTHSTPAGHDLAWHGRAQPTAQAGGRRKEHPAVALGAQPAAVSQNHPSAVVHPADKTPLELQGQTRRPGCVLDAGPVV
jgi:hypothetical protein